MMKMLIALDEERVKTDGIYDLADMWRLIDEKFAKYKCVKEVQSEGRVLYSGNPDYDYYTCMGVSYVSLKKQKWFAKYCTEWILYDNDDDEELPFQDINLLMKERERNPLFAV